MLPRLRRLKDNFFSTGALVILSIALVTSTIVALLPHEEPEGIEFWVFSTHHRDGYLGALDKWNRTHPESPFVMKLLSMRAIERRTLSGFLAGTPVGDLIASNLDVYPKAFLGPVEQVGFLDLTERVHAEGFSEKLNAPSFSTMTSRGRIFGMPRDVHPVLLAYRADLVEAAGIDVSQIETWDDYFRIMRPLMVEEDGNGSPNRYLLNISEVARNQIVMLMQQNDGAIFDEQDEPVFANPRNARVLATIISWLVGPEPVAAYVSSSQAGHRQQLEGFMVGNLMPDWLLGDWKLQNPRLSGKLKLMPLPAWERGGRRTSVLGGSNFGINKRSPHNEEAWELLKDIITSPEVAEQSWRKTNILLPNKELWSKPFYHEPDPFCCGQRVGSLYIEHAPHVPTRSSLPYAQTAYGQISDAAIALRAYAESHAIYDAEALYPEALRLLQKEQDALKHQMQRNLFHGPDEALTTLAGATPPNRRTPAPSQK